MKTRGKPPISDLRANQTHLAPRWAWHYRTLLALRDHLAGTSGDRARELFDPMESPSLHPEDSIEEVYDRDLARALPADSAEALIEIDAALRRLMTGTYGRCERTGRRIPQQQLRAMPWRRCVASSTSGA